MSAVLDIQNLTRTFGTFTAVDDVSFQVEEGQFFSILGPSGCGKTTLLRMIAGFLQPSAGSLKIRGRDMSQVPPNKRPVNLVFQNLALFPMMNVAENIAFGLKRQNKRRAEIRERVRSILERVGLEGFEDKRIEQLSGGQKQRVAIARSLVLEPSILLLDEPLGALDLKLREQMKIELKKLQSEIGTTFIYITHDQSEALVMSDIVAVMHHGRFEQIDTPRNLYERPAASFVAGFVGENNQLPAQIISRDTEFTIGLASGLCWRATPMESIPEGSCRVFIRPESVLLEPKAGIKNINRFPVTVRSILFDGSNTKLLATLAGSRQELTIALPQNRQFRHIQAGMEVEAGVAIESCSCYREAAV